MKCSWCKRKYVKHHKCPRIKKLLEAGTENARELKKHLDESSYLTPEQMHLVLR